MLAGDFFPGWANDNFGFGSIGIRFYPPVAFYLLAFTEMLGANWFWSLWSNLLFWMFLGSVGTFLFVKEWGTPVHGLIAGIGYAIVPQHLSEVFQFFLFAEFAAWAVIPFCFLFVTRICRKGKWIDVVPFFDFLFAPHTDSSADDDNRFSLPADVRAHRHGLAKVSDSLLAARSRDRSHDRCNVVSMVTIITEFDWLAHNDPRWAAGFYQYATWLFPNTLTSRNQFLYVLSSWLFDLSIVMTAALLIPAIVFLRKARRERTSDAWRIIAASVAVTVFAFFMLSRPSQFIWDALPFLQKLQFPWRWLSILSFAAVVAFALSVPRLLDLVKGRERFVAYPALALVVTIILFNITQIIIPSAPIPVAKFTKVEKQVAEEPMFEGWWPVWAKGEAFEQNPAPFADGRAIDINVGTVHRKP
jgi:branched-subunit amino acid transport protein